MKGGDTEDTLRMKRAVVVIYAVARAVKLQAHLFLGPQNPRDAKGTQARYAVWWVCYYRLGMTQGELAGMFRISDAGISYGIRRVQDLAEDSLLLCQAMEAAEVGARRAAKKYPLCEVAAERVERMAYMGWTGGKEAARAVLPGGAEGKAAENLTRKMI